MSILITGASGFVAHHLIQALLNQKVSHRKTIIATDVSLPQTKQAIPFFQLDLTDIKTTEKFIRKIAPQEIYHLAGYSSSVRSFQEPSKAILINSSLALNLLHSVSRLTHPCRVLMISTIQVYGKQVGKLTEKSAVKPLNPYAVSKLVMEEIARFYHRNFGIEVILVRSGNQIGPGQSPDYVLSSFGRQIVEIEKKIKTPVIEVGNIHVKRDFIDVRDAVQGYLLLMAKAKPGEVYNLARGKNILISEILTQMLSLSKLTPASIKISVSEERLRPEPKAEQTISVQKIKLLGFKPKIPLSQSLKDILEYWRQRLGEKK